MDRFTGSSQVHVTSRTARTLASRTRSSCAGRTARICSFTRTCTSWSNRAGSSCSSITCTRSAPNERRVGPGGGLQTFAARLLPGTEPSDERKSILSRSARKGRTSFDRAEQSRHRSRSSRRLSKDPASGPALRTHSSCCYSYWSASRTLSLEARLAGRIAASMPARIATATKAARDLYGIANTTP